MPRRASSSSQSPPNAIRHQAHVPQAEPDPGQQRSAHQDRQRAGAPEPQQRQHPDHHHEHERHVGHQHVAEPDRRRPERQHRGPGEDDPRIVDQHPEEPVADDDHAGGDGRVEHDRRAEGGERGEPGDGGHQRRPDRWPHRHGVLEEVAVPVAGEQRVGDGAIADAVVARCDPCRVGDQDRERSDRCEQRNERTGVGSPTRPRRGRCCARRPRKIHADSVGRPGGSHKSRSGRQ